VTIRLRVRELREAKGMTQEQLARAAKVRPATLTQIENARTTRVDLRVLERMAYALGVDPGFLIERVPAKRGR
jgi:transcriptional regulator with XRE-family HTH domain